MTQCNIENGWFSSLSLNLWLSGPNPNPDSKPIPIPNPNPNLGGNSVVVLNLEVWERPTHTTFNKCRNLILISFLTSKDLGEREKCGNSTTALVGNIGNQ